MFTLFPRFFLFSKKGCLSRKSCDNAPNNRMERNFKCIYPRRVDADLVAQLPIVKCPLPIELVETPEQLERALPEILAEKILGFDTETRPSFSKSQHFEVGILQLGGERKVWVIRLNSLGDYVADIYKVLERPDIVKAGLAVQGDIRSLSKRMQFKPAGFVDVSDTTYKMGVINTGMKNLAALFFGERVSKSAQMSNWDAEELTQKQVDYAATDAWISRRLYLEVKRVVDENNFELDPEPEPVPEPFSLTKFLESICGGVKKNLNTARRFIKKLFSKKRKHSSRRRRRGGRRRR